MQKEMASVLAPKTTHLYLENRDARATLGKGGRIWRRELALIDKQ